jgi:erythromycin esterase-like protein
MSQHLASRVATRAVLLLFVSLWLVPGRLAQTQRGTSTATADAALVASVRAVAHPLTGGERDHDPLLEMIGDARFVMLGEATHGTHEFYRERARITRRLVEEKGFDAVVVEAEWPDAARVGRYVLGAGEDATPEKALSNFKDFPRWMWRNRDVRDLVAWMRQHNDAHTDVRERVRFYGMDLYSLRESTEAVVKYLKEFDAEAARRARKRYDCLAYWRSEPQRYGYEVEVVKNTRSCERHAREQFAEMARIYEQRRGGASGADEELFSAYQNARVVQNGEAYFRTVFRGDISSWNARDRHMADTLDALAAHLDAQTGSRSKIVVWAHNTHQGDARMTERVERGELSVGQLMRQRHGAETVLVGFTTYTGHVRAASEWGGADERKRVRPALPGSYSALFHETGVPNFLLPLRGAGRLAEAFGTYRLERAIGVIYAPHTERTSHYFFARLARQFDAVIHFDTTTAVEPL